MNRPPPDGRPFEHLITTKPTPATCPRCEQPLLIGVADGLLVHADPTPLTPAAELAALLDGRCTYSRRRSGLAYRDADRITGQTLAGLPVHADHRCPPEARPRPTCQQLALDLSTEHDERTNP